MDVITNPIAIVVSAIVAMVVGFLWYGPILGKPWMKEKGYTPETIKEAQKGMGKLYGLSFLVGLITALVLSYVVQMVAGFKGLDVNALDSAITAFRMWVGFVMPVQVTATIFGEKKWKLFAIDTGYQLVSLLVMGAILGYWIGM